MFPHLLFQKLNVVCSMIATSSHLSQCNVFQYFISLGNSLIVHSLVEPISSIIPQTIQELRRHMETVQSSSSAVSMTAHTIPMTADTIPMTAHTGSCSITFPCSPDLFFFGVSNTSHSEEWLQVRTQQGFDREPGRGVRD